MHDFQGRLQQQQALIGLHQRHTAGRFLTRNGQKIGVGIVAQQGELEAAFTGGCTMASAHVAAFLSQDRLDLVQEARRNRLREPAHGHRYPHATPAHRARQ